MMVDYSEAFLRMEKDIKTAYNLMLKGKDEEAADMLVELGTFSVTIATWVLEKAYKKH